MNIAFLLGGIAIGIIIGIILSVSSRAAKIEPQITEEDTAPSGMVIRSKNGTGKIQLSQAQADSVIRAEIGKAQYEAAKWKQKAESLEEYINNNDALLVTQRKEATKERDYWKLKHDEIVAQLNNKEALLADYLNADSETATDNGDLKNRLEVVHQQILNILTETEDVATFTKSYHTKKKMIAAIRIKLQGIINDNMNIADAEYLAETE